MSNCINVWCFYCSCITFLDPQWIYLTDFSRCEWLYGTGESGDEIVSRLKRDLLPTMLNGIMYWPFCDFITFRFIRVHLQVWFISFPLRFYYCLIHPRETYSWWHSFWQPLVSNSFSYLWTVYMTYTASLEKPVSITCWVICYHRFPVFKIPAFPRWTEDWIKKLCIR